MNEHSPPNQSVIRVPPTCTAPLFPSNPMHRWCRRPWQTFQGSLSYCSSGRPPLGSSDISSAKHTLCFGEGNPPWPTLPFGYEGVLAGNTESDLRDQQHVRQTSTFHIPRCAGYPSSPCLRRSPFICLYERLPSASSTTFLPPWPTKATSQPTPKP